MNADKDIPQILNDGNTACWYDATDVSTITKDVDGYVSKIDDISGNNRSLSQATSTKKPKHSINGLEFLRSSDVLKSSSFTLIQPLSYYVVMKFNARGTSYVFDGYSADSCGFHISGGTENMYAGTNVSRSDSDNYENRIQRLVANGTSSSITKAELQPSTGNAGTRNPNGFALGSNYAGYSALMYVKEVIVRKVHDTAEDSLIIYNYLKTKHGI